MTVLAATAAITLGNLRYDSHAVAVDAELGLLPAINTITCCLPADVRFEASVGDDAEVVLDGGDGEARLMTGRVATITNDLARRAVTLTDAGGHLAGFRPAATYGGQSVTDIARSLADEVGAATGRLDFSGQLVAYVAHQGSTAAEHVARLAAIGGLIPSINGDGELEMRSRPIGPADIALLYGRELLRYRVDESAPPTPTMPIGHGPAGFAGSPDALIHSTEALSGSAQDPGPDAVWIPTPSLRTPDVVTSAGNEARSAAGAGASRLLAGCWLLPSLRPGMVVEIQGLPERLPTGPWLLTSARHRVRPGSGGTTTIEAVLGGSALGALLDAGMGAIGGLL